MHRICFYFMFYSGTKYADGNFRDNENFSNNIIIFERFFFLTKYSDDNKSYLHL